MALLFEKKMTKEEFGVRWEASKEKFYRFAYCYVKSEHDAWEILSEATYRAYCSLHKLKDPQYFETWINRIIINCACDYLKKNSRFVSIEDYSTEIADSDYDFSESETKLDAYELMEILTPDEKTLIILKYFEEKSFKEISLILEIPENTAKTKVYRALSKMKQHTIKE